jgi:hypothetical protein
MKEESSDDERGEGYNDEWMMVDIKNIIAKHKAMPYLYF